VKPEELKSAALALRELGLSFHEVSNAVDGVSNDVSPLKGLWKTNDESKLIKTGLALITFPEPTPISETLGAFVLALGMIQKKRGQSVLHIDDVYNTFREVLKGFDAETKK
jgi:hypothetical protein